MTPTFTVSSRTGAATLPELLHDVSIGQPVELPRCPAPFRAPVATALAVIMVALRHHATEPLSSPEAWGREWDRQVGADALRLVAPWNEVAFLQPCLPTEPVSPMSLENALAFPNDIHAVKPTLRADPEMWVYALMAFDWRRSVNYYPGGARKQALAVLPSEDGTLGSEVMRLVSAYESTPSPTVGSNSNPTRAADHFLWMLPQREEGRAVDTVPYPALGWRPMRLLGDGSQASTLAIKGSKDFIQIDGHLDDPHIPVAINSLGYATRYIANTMRPWSLALQHTLLFGKVGSDKTEPVSPSRVLTRTQYRFVRLCVVGTENGRTLGYRESFYPCSEGQQTFTLDDPDRAAQLSATALDFSSKAESRLASAVKRMLKDDCRHGSQAAVLAAARKSYQSAVEYPLTTSVLRLLARDADPAEEVETLTAITESTVHSVWRSVSAPYPPLARARGTLVINPKREEHPMTSLEEQAHTALSRLHLTPEQRARLRTRRVVGTPDLSYYTALAAMPAAWVENPRLEGVMRAVLTAMGEMFPSRAQLGWRLSLTGYHEMRVSRLLTATGESLAEQIAAVCRWLVSRGEEHAALGQLLALGIADATGDRKTRDAIRTGIGLSYARAQGRPSKPTEAA